MPSSSINAQYYPISMVIVFVCVVKHMADCGYSKSSSHTRFSIDLNFHGLLLILFLCLSFCGLSVHSSFSFVRRSAQLNFQSSTNSTKHTRREIVRCTQDKVQVQTIQWNAINKCKCWHEYAFINFICCCCCCCLLLLLLIAAAACCCTTQSVSFSKKKKLWFYRVCRRV